MHKHISFFNLSLDKLLSDDQSIIDQARIKLCYYTLCFGFLTAIVLWINLYPQQRPLLSLSATLFTVIILMLLKYFTWTADWKTTAHVLLGVTTVVNLLGIFYVLQTINVLTVLIIIVVVLYGYYMLGSQWGLGYSLINVFPVLGFLIYEYSNSYFISTKPERLDQSTIIISVLALFIHIIFIHSLFYSAFIQNIKQLKKTSQEQSKLNLELEVAIEKAEKSSQAKSEFLSTMSHEIRTPLNAVIGMSNLLLMSSPRPDQKENLDILKFSGSNLLAIVNDVLDFNKIESGKLVFENIKFNLPELMNNICGGQVIKAREKGIEFRIDIDESLRQKLVFGDPTRITQIIFNLVSNAIKFTQEGYVSVKAACIEDRHNNITVNFRVKDTGIGIEQNNLKAIFEPFTQESVTTTRQYGGTGLGLAIVKRLLELQHVQMKVQSKPGEGSEFSFNMEFPVSAEKYIEPVVAQPQISSQETEILKELKILIAEDNPVNVMLMKKLFSKWSIVPVFAENGERALENVQYGDFDIILMDLQMPVMNGFDASIEIRKLTDTKKSTIPIVALTASAMIDIRERVFSSGMNDYISKPFKPDELKEKILSLVMPNMAEH